MHIHFRRIALILVPVAAIFARPNYQATQAIAVAVVPATRQAPGASEVSITIKGDRRVIVANGLPDHLTGAFPNADNPNRISAQSYRYTVPARPVVSDRTTTLIRQPFGIALNGVLFDPATAELWQNDRASGWNYEAKGRAFSLGLDANNAHVQPNGAYHYHGVPTDLLARLSGGREQMTLVGWAADGFPIYGVWGHRDPSDPASPVVALKTSYRLKSGMRPAVNGQPGGTYDGIFVQDFDYVPGSGDLDECSGRFGVTPEFPGGTYHYVLTEDFPFVPRAFRGAPDPSFARQGAPLGRGGPPPR